ncbi:uncharacterized protein LOC144351881 [Saccoglossus kowalevskii]
MSSSAVNNLVLLKAVSVGRPRQVRLLLESDVGTETEDDCGQTALIRACYIENLNNQLKIVKMLLKAGADASKTDIVGRTALSWACLYGREKVVSCILDYRDLDLNQSDMNGCTALFHAVTSGSAATVKFMVDYLRKYALSVDMPNFNGVTPLMQALRLGHDVCASILIHQGKASTTRRDKDFLSAKDWAEKTRKAKKMERRRRPTFPPIISRTAANVIQFRENRAHRRGGSETDDEDGYNSDFWSIESTDKTNSTTSIDRISSDYLQDSPDYTEVGAESDDNGIVKDLSDDEQGDCCWSEEELFADDNESLQTASTTYSRPTHGQYRRFHDLPKIYSIYSNQLSSSYKPAYRYQKCARNKVETPHNANCSLDCCNGDTAVRPTIFVTDEMIQRAVVANRSLKKLASAKGDDQTVRKGRGRWADLRKKIAAKNIDIQKSEPKLPLTKQRHGNSPNNNGATNGKKDGAKKSVTFPSLGDGKIPLVSRQLVEEENESDAMLLLSTDKDEDDE